MNPSIADIRTSYSLKNLDEAAVDKDAIKQFDRWWQEALNAELTEPNAMTLATANDKGIPDARIVLLKGFSAEGFTFFTNYNSHKGRQLAQNPRACLVFFWKELERQVRITGTVSKLSKEESEAYFFLRPVGSQMGAIVSAQSTVLQNREELEEKLKTIQAAVDSGQPLQKPEHWGGYLVKPAAIEFWQGRPNRLHDRLLYTLQANNNWKIERLAP